MAVAAFPLFPDLDQVRLHHLHHQLLEVRLVSPAELGSGLACIAEQGIDLGGPEIARIDLNEHSAGRLVDAFLLDAAATPNERLADMGESLFDELAHRMRLAGRQHIVVRLALLQDQPHPLDKVAGVSPVARGIEIAEEQRLLQRALDRRDRSRDLPGDEGFAPDGALVVEKNTVGGVKAVGLAVVDRDPMRVKLGRGVRRARIERRGLPLWYLLHLTEQLGGRGLIEACLALQTQDPDGLEQTQGPECVGVGGVLRRLERDLHMRLRREIVYLVRPRLLNDADDVGRVGDVAVMQMERDPLLVGIINEMVDALRIERRGPALHAVDQIALRKKKCREVGAILPGHAGDERHLARRFCHHGPRGTYLQSTGGIIRAPSNGSAAAFWRASSADDGALAVIRHARQNATKARTNRTAKPPPQEANPPQEQGRSRPKKAMPVPARYRDFQAAR